MGNKIPGPQRELHAQRLAQEAHQKNESIRKAAEPRKRNQPAKKANPKKES
jgi:hypothetical protein